MAARRAASWLRWLVPLALCAPAAHADIDPPRPKDQPSPRLIPVCVTVHQVLCGLLDRDGRWAVEPAYSALYPEGEDGWYAERRGGLVGVLDARGKLRIEPRFEYIGPFVGGLARASFWERDKNGYIDERGDWAIPGQYFLAGDFVDGIAVVGQWVGGPNDGHAQMRYIDAQGRPAFPGIWTDAESFRYGMAVVRTESAVRTESHIDEAETGLIDRQGRYLLPMAPRLALTPIAPGRVLEQTATRHALLESHGKVLFQVPAEGDIDDAGEGRLTYRSGEDGRYGLLDALSGKVLVDASRGWLGPPSFSDGVAWVDVGEQFGERRALIDRDGRTLLEPQPYDGVVDFAGGAAPVSRNRQWQLIDRRGHALSGADYSGFVPAWDGPQSPRPGDVWIGVSGERRDWIGADGRLIARREPQPCGIEVLFDRAGKTIWPRDIEAACALKQENADEGHALASRISAERLQAARLERAREMVQWMVDVDRRDIEYRHDAVGRPSPLQALRQAPWQRGPAEIPLGDHVGLSLPPGFLYLAPEYEPAVAKATRGGWPALPESPASLPVALVANADLTVVLRLATVPAGRLPSGPLPLDPAALARRMTEGVTGFAGLDRMRGPRSLQWLVQPRWDGDAAYLAWAYSDLSTGNAANGLVFGRHEAVALQSINGSLFGEHLAMVAQDAIATLSRKIRFDSGWRYQDSDPADPAAPLDLVGYITPTPERAGPSASTGVPPAPTAGDAVEASAVPDEDSSGRMAIALLMGGVLIALLLLLVRTRRSRP